MDFAQFVTGWLSDPEPEYARVGRQSRFVSNAQGKVIVDHLFRYEDLPQAVDFLEARLGVRLALGRHNPSPKADLTLPPALAARLQQEAAADFALWAGLAR